MSELNALIQQKQALLAGDKPVRARQAAEQLGVSEAQYVALSCGESVEPLDMSRIKEFFERLSGLGELMALTRNAQIVMEHHGEYRNPVFDCDHVMFNQADIDLRLKFSAWKFGFSVDENGRKSFQFYDQYGVAAHKIYITKHTDQQAYEQLVNDYCLSDCPQQLLAVEPLAPQVESQPSEVNSDVIRQEWRRLREAHHVNKLLKQFGLTRAQAYRHLGDDAVSLQKDSLKKLITYASENQLPLLMFAANDTATQTHNGKVSKLLETGPWFNVLDPRFNLHALMTGIDETWLVKKYLGKTDPTCSIEFFNAEKEAVLMIYLHPDAREDENLRCEWKEMLEGLIDKEFVA